MTEYVSAENTNPVWLSEPDRLELSHAGMRCLIIRHHTFHHLCGYVEIPKEHPLYGVGYSENAECLVGALRELMNERFSPNDKRLSMLNLLNVSFGMQIDPCPASVFKVHGGITFSGTYKDLSKDPKSWFYGFDCAHFGDVSPYFAHLEIYAPEHEYRSMDYVVEECKWLAEQLSCIPYLSDTQEETNE